MNPFQDYLNLPDESFAWSQAGQMGPATLLHLVSQTWQGHPWVHSLSILQPERVSVPGVAVLEISGGPANVVDMERAHALAERTGIPVAVIHDIPNQPLWGMVEDDLIAHTFEMLLDSDDTTWPLLFPMVKATQRAMDTLFEWSLNAENPLERFITTGSSKRGWTAWLTGAMDDPRVIGIAPRVYDNLNLPAQLHHQLTSWGEFSPMWDDYTRRTLHQSLESEAGRALASMVDPFTYRHRMRCPVLSINGANDAYWCIDAAQNYWRELPQNRSFLMLPNEGHNIGDPSLSHPGLGAFVRSCAGLFDMPSFSSTLDDGHLVYIGDTGLQAVTIWLATSEDRRFDSSEWIPSSTITHPSASVALPKVEGYMAVYALARYVIGGEEVLTGSLPVVVG